MKLTVAQYASSRNISEATAKKAIKKKQWELEQNPNDNRQRLLSLQQQAELDTAIPKAAPPSATPIVPTEIVHYHRPTEVGMVLAERTVCIGEITYAPQTAIDDPLFQALQAQVEAMKAQNAAITQQVNISMTASRDTAAAIDGLKQLQIIQEAESQAYRDFQLRKQAHAAATQRLEMQSAGLSPVPAPGAPAAPPPQPTPTDYSKSPF